MRKRRREKWGPGEVDGRTTPFLVYVDLRYYVLCRSEVGLCSSYRELEIVFSSLLVRFIFHSFSPIYPSPPVLVHVFCGAVVAVDSKQKLSLDTSVDSVPKWLALETVLLFPVITIALNSRLAKKVLILNLQSNR